MICGEILFDLGFNFIVFLQFLAFGYEACDIGWYLIVARIEYFENLEVALSVVNILDEQLLYFALIMLNGLIRFKALTKLYQQWGKVF